MKDAKKDKNYREYDNKMHCNLCFSYMVHSTNNVYLKCPTCGYTKEAKPKEVKNGK